jgi:hypothetical protein
MEARRNRSEREELSMSSRIDERDDVRPGRQAASTSAPRWSWRSTDLFESEEEGWLLVSRWRALEKTEEYGLDEYGGERRDRRAQDHPKHP